MPTGRAPFQTVWAWNGSASPSGSIESSTMRHASALAARASSASRPMNSRPSVRTRWPRPDSIGVRSVVRSAPHAR